jgi:predicted acyltransferase
MKRWRALDDLRGLTILVMIPVNAMMDFSRTPAWLKHSPGPGMTLADLVLPAFLFSMGISASFSIGRRSAEQGLVRTLLHGLWRYGLLFAFGTAGYFLVWHQANWEVLQLLGLAGAFAFLFMFLPPRVRPAAAIALLIGCELLRAPFLDGLFRAWYAGGIGGPWGFLPYSALPLAASGLGEMLREADTGRRVRLCLSSGGIALVCGFLWSLVAGPPDKHLVTGAYLLLGGGTACLCLGILCALEAHCSLPALTVLGRNPLLMYMASGVLILPIRARLDPALPEALAWLVGSGVLAVCVGLAWLLDHREIRIKL